MGTNLFDGITFFDDTSNPKNEIYALGVAGTPVGRVGWARERNPTYYLQK